MNDERKMPYVIGFYGYSNSGKTSLIYKLIQALAVNGISVSVIKQTDKAISSEPNEKDTSGYRAAGAKSTSFSSTTETNFVIPEKMDLNGIIKIQTTLLNPDLIFVEGASDPAIEKIRLGERPVRENTIFQYEDNFEELYQLILSKLNRRIKDG